MQIFGKGPFEKISDPKSGMLMHVCVLLWVGVVLCKARTTCSVLHGWVEQVLPAQFHAAHTLACGGTLPCIAINQTLYSHNIADLVSLLYSFQLYSCIICILIVLQRSMNCSSSERVASLVKCNFLQLAIEISRHCILYITTIYNPKISTGAQ